MDRSAHICAIRADPDNPEPALVFADWLLERGDPRGELIAIEHQLADNGAEALRRRRDELLAVHQRRWLLPLEELGAWRPELQRGLVWWVKLRGRAVANLGEICRIEPILGASLDSGGRGPFEAAAAAPELAGIRSLLLGGRFPTGIEQMLGSAYLGGLDHLSIMHPLSAGAATALAGGLARPKTLHVEPDADSAGILAASGLLDRVAKLNWSGNDDALAVLAGATLAELRNLCTNEPLGAAGLVALGPRLDQLETLECASLDAAAVRVLVTHIRSGRLRRLVTNIHDEKAQVALLKSPVLVGVEDLDLPDTQLSKRAIRALRRSLHRGQLRSMWLPKTRNRFELDGVAIEWEGW